VQIRRDLFPDTHPARNGTSVLLIIQEEFKVLHHSFLSEDKLVVKPLLLLLLVASFACYVVALCDTHFGRARGVASSRIIISKLA
jgi:hypothetical protein